MSTKILCGMCKYCHLEVFSEGCGSSLCYICMYNGYRIIRVDGPIKDYLIAPKWCPGIDIGEQKIISNKLKLYLRNALADIRYDHRFEGTYIYKKAKHNNIVDWESLLWLFGFFTICILTILFLSYSFKDIMSLNY